MKTFGYARKILRVDLSSRSIAAVSTLDYSDKFLGGRGIAAKFYWDEVPPEAGAFDAENGLIFATGPLAGIPVLGGSRWQVCGKSPAPSPEHFCYCNLGGRWGAELKFAGYDAIVVQGKSEKPVYLLLHDDTAELRDASGLWGKGAIETREMLSLAICSFTSSVWCNPLEPHRHAPVPLTARVREPRMTTSANVDNPRECPKCQEREACCYH